MKPWRTPTYIALAISIAIFASSLVFALQNLTGENRRVATEFRDNIVWYAGQFDYELLKFLAALDSYYLGDAAVAHEDLLAWFDILWSRIENATDGVMGAKYSNLEGAPAALARARQTLRRVEPMVTALRRGDESGFRAIRGEIAALSQPLHDLALVALQHRGREMAAGRDRFNDLSRRILLFFGGMFLSGGILIFLVLREIASVNALRGVLEQRVEERTRELQARESEVKKLNERLEQRVLEQTAELRAAQEDLLRNERLATLGQLTGTVSHELRNPLGSMRASIAVIKRLAAPENPVLKSSVEIVDRSITRCDNIITDLLDFTRAQDLAREPTDVDTWLGGVLDEYQTPVPSVTLRRDLAAGVELSLDRDRLRRAVVNVLDNACQAMAEADDPAGAARQRLITVASRVQGDRLVLSIRDTGKGLAPELLEEIFKPLFSTKSFGVGLGLPLVRRTMEQHGGGAELQSAPGEGAEVTLWLPLPRPAGTALRAAGSAR